MSLSKSCLDDSTILEDDDRTSTKQIQESEHFTSLEVDHNITFAQGDRT